jgi:hypothetical protein
MLRNIACCATWLTVYGADWLEREWANLCCAKQFCATWLIVYAPRYASEGRTLQNCLIYRIISFRISCFMLPLKDLNSKEIERGFCGLINQGEPKKKLFDLRNSQTSDGNRSLQSTGYRSHLTYTHKSNSSVLSFSEGLEWHKSPMVYVLCSFRSSAYKALLVAFM